MRIEVYRIADRELKALHDMPMSDERRSQVHPENFWRVLCRERNLNYDTLYVNGIYAYALPAGYSITKDAQ